MSFMGRWRRSRKADPPVPTGADSLKNAARQTWGTAKPWFMRARTEIEKGAKKVGPVARSGIEKAAPVAKRGMEKAAAAGESVAGKVKARWNSRARGGAE